MNLYIDTNIFLTFYHLSKADLNELKKLSLLIRSERIKLFLPEQTLDEFERNREKSISDAIDLIKDNKISKQLPQIAKGYDDHSELLESIKKFENHKNNIISQILKDAGENKLNADLVLSEIFAAATIVPVTKEILLKAKTRFDRGNPPGKGNSYGDSINWECLLSAITILEELHLISDDTDYSSKLDRSSLNSFLIKEWKKEGRGDIFYYKSLTDFIKRHFSQIELSDQFEKEMTIAGLANASSFYTAKMKLKSLSKYSEFTQQELNDIIEIATTNNQIYWISDDYGVGDVLAKIIEGKEDLIEPDLLKRFQSMFFNKEEDDDEFPF